MASLAPHTPVIVGIGFHQEKTENPLECSEPYQSMVRAIRNAAQDAGSDTLLQQIDSIAVLQGLWHYCNPGKLIAEALGSPMAKSAIADLGVLQLTPLSDLCQAIQDGEQQIGVITAGEAKFRELRSNITKQPVSNTQQPEDTPLPETHYTSSDPFCSDLEAQRGLAAPVEFFAIIESALRHSQKLGMDEHRDKVAELYQGFSEIAAGNLHAWRREPVSAEEIRNPAAKNSMLAFPYTKLHCSQWNVNRSAAVIVCSAAKAQELGLDSAGWIYPWVSVQSKHVVPLAQQRQLHSHLGAVLSGERVLELGGVSVEDVMAADLYSCFPSAVQSFARDLKLVGSCPLSVTGAMPFGGGPFNHASLDGVARMVEVLREGEPSARRIGLVSNLSGIFGKQACALFSNVPAEAGFQYEDITKTVAERDVPVALDAEYSGPATIVGYTVVYKKDEPSHAIAICDTPAGKRTVVRSEDKPLLEIMTQQEFCGRSVSVESDGRFSSPAS